MGTTTLGKKNDVTTALGNKQSTVVFCIAIFVIISVFFLIKNYQELSGETIVIEDQNDVVQTKVTIAESLEELAQDKEALRLLLS